MRKLSDSEFNDLVLSHRRAFHLEMKEEYHVAEEDEPLRQFLASEPVDAEWMRSWFALVREATSGGVAMQRVRIVSEPLNDYARFLLDLSRGSTDAGEDIRYLPRDKVVGIDFPVEDCWLFDDSTLVLVIFAVDGRSYSTYLSADPELTKQYVRVRDQVWERAIPYSEYMKRAS